MNTLRLIPALVACSSLALPAGAVSLSANGTGQVLIWPYYTTQGTYNTLFSVVNPTTANKAVKLRFHEARNNREVLDFNLYLSRGASFIAMITSDAAGNPVLRTPSTACTIPAFTASAEISGWSEIAFSNANYAGYDMAGSGLDRAREGYFEAIEMGQIKATNLGEWDAVNKNCITAMPSLSSGGAGLSPPTGDLFGMGTLINVLQGTDYSFDPVALDDFTTTKRYTAPGSASPNLGDADSRSTVLVHGTAITSTWNSGIDAVSAVMMHEQVWNEYIGPSTTLDAATDIVLTFPTKGFYVTRMSDTQHSTRLPFNAPFHDVNVSDGDSAGGYASIGMTRTSRDGRANSLSSGYGFPLSTNDPPIDPGVAPWATTVISFGQALGAAKAIPIVQGNGPTNDGQLSISLGGWFTSIEGQKYHGLPVIGFVVQKYVNGNLNGVLSNYGGTLAHKYVTRIE